MIKLIERDSYPNPYLEDRDGTWYCRVHVPTSLFYLFGKNSKQAVTIFLLGQACAAHPCTGM